MSDTVVGASANGKRSADACDVSFYYVVSPVFSDDFIGN